MKAGKKIKRERVGIYVYPTGRNGAVSMELPTKLMESARRFALIPEARGWRKVTLKHVFGDDTMSDIELLERINIIEEKFRLSRQAAAQCKLSYFVISREIRYENE